MSELKRLYIEGLADYHCHCDYSIDATGSIDEYCQAAIQRGLVEICFTTHYDANPHATGGDGFIGVNGERRPINPENLAPYVDDVLRANERYFGEGLAVRLGLEFGWYSGCEEHVARLRQLYDFDYVLCGLHELENTCFCCSDEYERCLNRYSVERMAELYFSDAIAAASSGLFDAIAHLDYYRKYGEKFYGPKVNEIHRPYIAELFGALNSTGTAIEINTAALRRGFLQSFPSVEIINAARRAEVEIGHLGSDAHSPDQVGYEFETVAPLAPRVIEGCDD
jgi:histidinol-phosphatase (PHP family)